MYGIDLGDPGIAHGRSWPWLRARIYGLMTTDCAVYRANQTPPEQTADGPETA